MLSYECLSAQGAGLSNQQVVSVSLGFTCQHNIARWWMDGSTHIAHIYENIYTDTHVWGSEYHHPSSAWAATHLNLAR